MGLFDKIFLEEETEEEDPMLALLPNTAMIVEYLYNLAPDEAPIMGFLEQAKPFLPIALGDIPDEKWLSLLPEMRDKMNEILDDLMVLLTQKTAPAIAIEVPIPTDSTSLEMLMIATQAALEASSGENPDVEPS